MTKKHRGFLHEILSNPVRSNISWKDAEKVLVALGARVREGNFSRARVELNGIKAVFQRPPADKHTNKKAIVSLARFLREAKVDLNEI